MSSYHEERRANWRRRAVIAAYLADRMPGWRAVMDPEDDWVRLHREADGATINVSKAWPDQKRVQFSACWPESRANRHTFRGELKAITVSPDRPLEDVWRDFERRFLHPYLEQFGRQEAIREEYDAGFDRSSAIAIELAELVGTKARRPPQSSEPPDRWDAGDWQKGPWHLKGRACPYSAKQHGMGVKLEIECTPEIARKIERLLAAE